MENMVLSKLGRYMVGTAYSKLSHPSTKSFLTQMNNIHPLGVV